MSILTIFTDGASKGNPGPSAIGILGFVDGKEVFRHKESIGVATNNTAEYKAVIKALELAATFIKQTPSIKTVQLYSDSTLMVNQLNGLFKVKNASIREYVFTVRTLESLLGRPIAYTAIPREKNALADALVNEVF